LIFFALFANINVDIVSPRYAAFGETLAKSFVFEFPPRESFKKKVNLESRNGICFFFFAD
jgi:hypothetical protein